ncbi:MAG: hypothetical protein JNK05_12975 [Myxococcales bacterium]|nr:hypothetical protein [Myxococcales bacterium]
MKKHHAPTLFALSITLMFSKVTLGQNTSPPARVQAAPSAPQEREHEPIGAEGTPSGRFAFSTQAGAHRLFVRAGADVIAQYALRVTETPAGTDWFHRFDLGRAHAALSLSWGPARARLVLEAVRSASEGALLGVAGDSLLFRVREGYAAWRPFTWLEAQAGVVPTLTIPTLETAWGARAIAPASLESTGLGSPADLGVTVRAALPRALGTVAIGAFNGEGYALRELNRGKNLEIAADLRPFATLGLRELAIVGSFVLGSSGTGRARSDRLTVGAQFDRRRYGGGVSTTIAWGVADASERTSVLAEAFARVEPIERWLLAARLTYWNRNLAVSDDALWTVLFGTGVRLAEPLSAWVAASRSIAGAATVAALPGVDAWEVRVVARAVF